MYDGQVGIAQGDSQACRLDSLGCATHPVRTADVRQLM